MYRKGAISFLKGQDNKTLKVNVLEIIRERVNVSYLFIIASVYRTRPKCENVIARLKTMKSTFKITSQVKVAEGDQRVLRHTDNDALDKNMVLR